MKPAVDGCAEWIKELLDIEDFKQAGVIIVMNLQKHEQAPIIAIQVCR
ncbi:MAG: hypothetical protein VKO44_05050 [Cyanobacteriota bacterium]|nr:hypothetical protein [Cyanobacteriota bacterium]